MSEYRDDEETVEAIANWWRENGLFLVGAVVLAVGGVLGWNAWQSHSQQQAEAAAAQYAQWRTATDDERDALAEALAEAHPDSGYLALIALQQARDAVAEGDVDTAQEALQRLLETGVPASLKDVARLRLARLELEAGAADAALTLLDAAAETSAREELRGDALLANQQPQEARAAYRQALALAESPRRLLQIKVDDLNGVVAEGEVE